MGSGRDQAVRRPKRRGQGGGGAWRLDGHKSFVLDGHTAGLILAVAATDSGLSLLAVDAGESGLTRTPLAALDQTRKLARLEVDAVTARAVRPARARPSSSAARSTRSTWPWSTRRSGISLAGPSGASRRSSTGART